MKVTISETKIILPTYPSPAPEEMPMFAENRVHQRSSGDPYPNKVVLEVDREHRQDKEYTLVRLENQYVRIEILPEIGGRIYSAYDKSTGYDYFYKQHVIKPALIGVLGSWVSGGVEFNWPFHHRPSGFKPCDFVTEELPDGSAVCHLSEHDPIDRMKGMVSIILRPDATYLETSVRLYNRTDAERSFLWWENAAVPVNEDYQIFFPPDVTYVNFHYLKSRTTYPLAGGGAYNGIPMKEARDISYHKNTKQATSYFACASKYDFFGGYDHGRESGVVHIGDHHISPGKKMFTWAYCQLAESWERALTDTDGAYAELMAGSYSDNQPDFAWLAPYETKCFSQYWYPIQKVGSPTFANLNCALRIDREAGVLHLQSTKKVKGATLTLSTGLSTTLDLDPVTPVTLPLTGDETVSITLTAAGKVLAEFTEPKVERALLPEVITDMPSAAGMQDADELYLAGVHVQQYRDPHVKPDSYWKTALERKPNHIPSLIAMAKYELSRYLPEAAQTYILRALSALTRYNAHPQSGDAYYTYGRILEAKGEYDSAYDQYQKAYWAADSVARAMTRIALIDLRRDDFAAAVTHAEKALSYGRDNSLAVAALAVAERELGHTDRTKELLSEQLKRDPLDHFARFLCKADDLYSKMDSDATQTCLDIAFDLAAMGRKQDAYTLLSGLEQAREDARNKLLYYALGYFGDKEHYAKAETAPSGDCYPHRYEEIAVLKAAIGETGADEPKMLLGCLYYHKRQYEKAAALWEQTPRHPIARRNLAVAYFSHLHKEHEALTILRSLVSEYPENEELRYEYVTLMDKMGIDPREKIALLTERPLKRDDLFTELAKAYNQTFDPDKALHTLLSHPFVPCEGGEHAIADQYLFACLVKGKKALDAGNCGAALEHFVKGQALPQSLGAGIWNHCKLIPLKFHEALCLEILGNKEKAREIYEYIADVEIEYFSNMHLPELPYWQALSLRRLGRTVEAVRLIARSKRQWEEIKDVRDNGFFGTTPFFIPFMDDPEKLRRAKYLYLTALCDSLTENEEAADKLEESISLQNENLFALFLNKFGFIYGD